MNSQEKGLLIACKKGNEKKVLELLKAGVNVNTKDTYGETPLMYAAKRGNLDIVKILLDYRADVNETTNDGKTALMYACEANNIEMLKSMIIANKKEVGLKGLSKLLNNCKKGNKEIIDILIDNGANLYAVDRKGKSVLVNAVDDENIDIINYLVEKGVSLNIVDKEGKTALMYAIDSDNTKMIKQLIKAQAYNKCNKFACVGMNIKNLEIAKQDVEYIKNSDWFNNHVELKNELEEDIKTIKLLKYEDEESKKKILEEIAMRRKVEATDDIIKQKGEILKKSIQKLWGVKEVLDMVDRLEGRVNLGIESSIVNVALMGKKQGVSDLTIDR